MSKELEAKKQEKIDVTNEVKASKKELVKFRKENGLKSGEEPGDPKLLKTLKKLVSNIEAKEKQLVAVKAEVKELTPKKTGGFAAKYDYPKVKDEETGEEREMDAKEKKAYRVKARAEAKKAEKADAKEGAKETPKTPTKKKVVKKKKAEAQEEEEDDD